MRLYREGAMRRFQILCPVLIFLFWMLACMAGELSNARPAFTHFAFGTTMAWLLVAIVVFLRRVAGRLAHAVGPVGLASRSESAWPQPAGNMIEGWCRQTGWVLADRVGDHYRVRSGDSRSPVTIEVRYTERQVNVVFQSFFAVRFSLEKPPAGLFARVLLRSTSLKWASWGMSIGESCEACLYVSASIPSSSADARVFNAICQEIANEIRAFHQELHDKFAYDLSGVTPEVTPWDRRGGLPMRWGDNLPGGHGGMKFLE